MALSEELAYLGVIEIARGIRQRHFSPAEVVDAFIARIEARDRTINAFVYRGFDEARVKAKDAEKALTDGRPLGPLHGVPVAIKICSTSSLAGSARSAASAPCATSPPTSIVRLPSASKTRAPSSSERPTARSWVFAARATIICSHRPNIPSTPARTRAARRAAALPRSRTDFCHSRKAPTAADRSASRHPGATSTATRPPSDACLASCGPTLSVPIRPSSSKGRSRATWKTRRSRSMPFRDTTRATLTASTRKQTSSLRPGDRSRAGRSPIAPTSTCSRSMLGSPRRWPRRCACSRRPALMWKK